MKLDRNTLEIPVLIPNIFLGQKTFEKKKTELGNKFRTSTVRLHPLDDNEKGWGMDKLGFANELQTMTAVEGIIYLANPPLPHVDKDNRNDPAVLKALANIRKCVRDAGFIHGDEINATIKMPEQFPATDKAQELETSLKRPVTIWQPDGWNAKGMASLLATLKIPADAWTRHIEIFRQRIQAKGIELAT